MSDTDNALKQIMPALRKFVSDQIEENCEPQDLSFALAYVATELGLHFTDNSTTVFPVILRAMSHAVDARHAADGDDSQEPENEEDNEGVPIEAVLH